MQNFNWSSNLTFSFCYEWHIFLEYFYLQVRYTLVFATCCFFKLKIHSFFENFVQCILSHSSLSIPPTSSYPFPTLTTLGPLFVSLTIQANLCCPNTLGCVAIYWDMAVYQGITFLKSTASSSPRNCPL